MGDYIIGTHGYHQRDLLARAGKHVVCLWGHMPTSVAWHLAWNDDAAEETRRIPLLPLFGAVMRANLFEPGPGSPEFALTRDRTEFRAGVQTRDGRPCVRDLLGTLEAYLVPLLLAVDDALTQPVETLRLEAQFHFKLLRRSWPRIPWAGRYLSNGLDLARLCAPTFVDDFSVLLQRNDESYFMVLTMLRHAMMHDLDVFEARQQGFEVHEPTLWSTLARNFSRNAREFSGISAADALFAQGLLQHLAGTKAATATLGKAHRAGAGRAFRWLALRGAAPAAPAGPVQPLPTTPEGLAALEANQRRSDEVAEAFELHALAQVETLPIESRLEHALTAMARMVALPDPSRWEGIVQGGLALVLKEGDAAQLRRGLDLLQGALDRARHRALFHMVALPAARLSVRLGDEAALVTWANLLKERRADGLDALDAALTEESASSQMHAIVQRLRAAT
ncbi:hypothetical protein [Chondromyces crocatus]|uniref:Uncharacterized protein n=1 Tax=Chondromyces crocatus TaxID=52 RepID=A0A0K1EMV6_CHOCO|nr:hypothetical protein [Chondromyces crocatus]AKT42179.1 uncharacterized protein CMC5_064020 [Chondromyces crocatus]